MSPRKTKISFQINKGAAASKPVTSCKASLNITCHHFTAPFRSLILYTICLFKQSTLYIHFIKTLQWLISKSKNWHHTKRAALVHGSDQPSQKKSHFIWTQATPGLRYNWKASWKRRSLALQLPQAETRIPSQVWHLSHLVFFPSVTQVESLRSPRQGDYFSFNLCLRDDLNTDLRGYAELEHCQNFVPRSQNIWCCFYYFQDLTQ